MRILFFFFLPPTLRWYPPETAVTWKLFFEDQSKLIIGRALLHAWSRRMRHFSHAESKLPRDDSLFPVLEWPCLFRGSAGCRPNNRPHWLTLTFCPLEQSLQSHSLCLRNLLSQPHCLPVGFEPCLCWFIISSCYTQHALWLLEQTSFVFLQRHNCANISSTTIGSFLKQGRRVNKSASDRNPSCIHRN